MFVKIDHLNISVSNLQESVEWYGEIFNFKDVEAGKRSGQEWAIVANNDFMICMTDYPEKKIFNDNQSFEFHQIYHFGFRVNNKEEWEKVIAKNDLKVEYGGAVEYPNSQSWYVQDPSGYEIEVSCLISGDKLF